MDNTDKMASLESRHTRPELAGMRVAAYQPRRRSRDYFVNRIVNDFVNEQICKHAASGMIVADLGCGEQPFRKTLEARGAEYIGVDVTQNGANSVNIIAPITALAIEDQSVDLILCTEVLEHVSDTYQAFKEMRRILRAGGIAIITVPFTYRLHEQPYDFVRFTPHQIAECSRVVGLSVDDLRRGGNDLQVVAQSLDQALHDAKVFGAGRGGQLVRAGFRLACNTVIDQASKWFGARLPALQYISTLAVVRRAS